MFCVLLFKLLMKKTKMIKLNDKVYKIMFLFLTTPFGGGVGVSAH